MCPPQVSNMLQMFFIFEAMTEAHMEEQPLESWADLLASFVEVLGLITGFSLMSVFELLIYAMLVAYERCSRQRWCHH